MKVAGRWRSLYRAVDQYGQVIDVLLSEQRDTVAARTSGSWTNSSQPLPTSRSSTATYASTPITAG